MTNTNPIKKRLTITANDELIERAKKAMRRDKMSSLKEVAELAGVGLSTISKFFNQKPIRLDSYTQICETLSLNEKIVIGEEKIDFTISGRIDKQLIEKFKDIVEILQQLTGDDLSLLIKEEEEEDMK